MDQLLLEDTAFTYDRVGNPTVIDDLRNPAEWPSGAKPRKKTIAYDALYRAVRVDYTAKTGTSVATDAWVSPFAAERAGTATATPQLPKPMPEVTFAQRGAFETYAYDGLGNLTSSDDDTKGFFDRSLGTQTMGTATTGPYRLQAATNRTPTTGATGRRGDLAAGYDAAGNLTTLIVKRDGACAPSTGSCWQRFAYAWDEAGRLMTARRWDLTTTERTSKATVASTAPTRAADALLSYRYAGDDTRVLKTLVQGGVTLHTAYVFPSYTLRRAATTGTGTATDYVQSASTEEVRLEAGGEAVGRVLVSTADLSASAVTGQRVLLTLGDHLGSTSTVIDRETGERVESVTYTAYGRSESDVRPDRYKGLREDVRFTGNEDDVEVGLTSFAKRYYAPALGRWASPDPLAVHAPGDADLNLYAYVHGRVYAATDPLGLDPPDTMADGKLFQAMNPGQQQAALEHAKGVLDTLWTGAKAAVGGALCARFPSACGWLAAGRLATEGYDHDSAGQVLAEEALNLAGARFATRGKPGAPSQAIVEKELAATAAPLADAAEGTKLLTSGAPRRFLGDRAVQHFEKHARSVMKALGKTEYNLANYLDDANHVIQSGTWAPELNGYVKLVGGPGSAKAAFVGVDRAAGNITTFHIKTVKELSRSAPSLGWTP